MTGAERILLALARHHATQGHAYTLRDIEFDATLWRAAQRLSRESVIEITQPCDGITFSAALAARAA